MEALYGVGTSKAKVIVTEFRIPMDAETYSGAEADVVQFGPGRSFWTGFFVDGDDTPYTDVQRLIGWPTTFGVFNPKEDGALATCE